MSREPTQSGETEDMDFSDSVSSPGSMDPDFYDGPPTEEELDTQTLRDGHVSPTSTEEVDDWTLDDLDEMDAKETGGDIGLADMAAAGHDIGHREVVHAALGDPGDRELFREEGQLIEEMNDNLQKYEEQKALAETALRPDNAKHQKQAHHYLRLAHLNRDKIDAMPTLQRTIRAGEEGGRQVNEDLQYISVMSAEEVREVKRAVETSMDLHSRGEEIAEYTVVLIDDEPYVLPHSGRSAKRFYEERLATGIEGSNDHEKNVNYAKNIGSIPIPAIDFFDGEEARIWREEPPARRSVRALQKMDHESYRKERMGLKYISPRTVAKGRRAVSPLAIIRGEREMAHDD